MCAEVGVVLLSNLDRGSPNWLSTVQDRHRLLFYFYLAKVYILWDLSHFGSLKECIMYIFVKKKTKQTKNTKRKHSNYFSQLFSSLTLIKSCVDTFFLYILVLMCEVPDLQRNVSVLHRFLLRVYTCKYEVWWLPHIPPASPQVSVVLYLSDTASCHAVFVLYSYF